MIRAFAVVVVTLCVSAAAQAETAVYAEITYPTSTTWRLWLTETTNWSGSPATFTPSGYGIASFEIVLSGASLLAKMTPSEVSLFTDDDPPVEVGTVGFLPPEVWPVVNMAAGRQDTTNPLVLFRGFGVSAGTYVPPPGYLTSGPYSWAAPGAPGSASPGVLVYGGKRPSGDPVSIMWDYAQATVFTSDSGVGTMTVDVVPEPATLALLAVAALAAARRRR